MDPAHDTEWVGGVVEAETLGDGPLGEGTRVSRTAKFLGRRIEYVNEVAEFDPAGGLVMQSVKSPFPIRVSYAFADVDGGTRVTVRVEGEASGFFALASPLLAAAVQRSVSRDLRRLKEALEDSDSGR